MSPPLVLDTNIVLDLFVFQDDAVAPLREALAAGRWRWIATAAMREELRRVLDYPHIAARLTLDAGAEAVMARFDAHVTLAAESVRAPATCQDPDDQKFIDLAVEHGGLLLSKDGAVLALRKRLLQLGVTAGPSLDALTPA